MHYFFCSYIFIYTHVYMYVLTIKIMFIIPELKSKCIKTST